ncbi:PREDICTED: serologically defined colon cancer antigen 3-like [Ficedula albicollis]|uniref:serologically defined colon cancer antigen 3-like n=1 Tax=Ficedula albicollis TaxID=59894 RepID=UPI0003599DF4|nr:PREDICTED: serologically defined colon cancer antigen 3-like [Ficedula albicollis]
MSQPFHMFGLMMMIYPESQGLQGNDDNDDDDDDDETEESGEPCHSELSSPWCKSNDSTDDTQTENLREPTPFPLKPAQSYTVKKNPMGLAKHALELEKEDQEFQEPVYKDMGMSDNSAEDEEPSQACHLPGHQRLPALQKAGTAPRGFHNPFQRSSGQHLGAEAAARQTRAREHYVGHPESTPGAKPHGGDSEESESPSLQPTYDLLWQENSSLRLKNETLKNVNLVLASENFAFRRALREVKKNNPASREKDAAYSALREQCDRLEGENAELRKDNAAVRRMFYAFQSNLKREESLVCSLQEKLTASQAEREREARAAQSLVQQAESRLQLMSQRALDAETNVERLKQKVFILQGQLERCKLENEKLRTDWPGSSEAEFKHHQAKPPQAHNGQRWLPQAAPASAVLPVVAEVLESTRKILKF